MDLAQAIQNNRKIRLHAYSVGTKIEQRTQRILQMVLHKHNCTELLSPLYTCIKELLVNAVKANYKNIFFENYAPSNDPDSIVDYQKALEMFRLEMSYQEAKNFERISRQKDIRAEVIFHLDNSDFTVEVHNPVPMTDMELQTVQKKLHDARECDDITDYFLMSEDDPNKEGAGLGLVLISMIIKSLGIPESSFFISRFDSSTVASLSVPLTPQTLEHFRNNTADSETSAAGM